MCVFRHTNTIHKDDSVAEEKQGRFTNNVTLIYKSLPTNYIHLNTCAMNEVKMKGLLDAFLIWCICSLQQHVGLLLLHTIICRMTYSSTSCIIDENNSLVRIDNIVLNILYINIGKCYTTI